MPQYKVKVGQKGFYDGKLYDSQGKRPILVTDKPLKPVPKWVEPLKVKSVTAEEQAAAQKAAEEAKAAAEAAKKAEKEAAEAKAAADSKAAAKPAKTGKVDAKTEVDAVTFTESPKATVETL